MSIYCEFTKKLGNFFMNVQFEGGNEVLSLLGASGSGKSMILRCIAGVERPDTGVIKVNEKIWFDSENGINLPTTQRKAGLLFQDYALFPHMTVKENLDIVAKANEQGREVVEHLLKIYQLEGQQKQYPSQLSGGQKQRCAIARILLTTPEIILLDEPFSALDRYLKGNLEKELFSSLKSYEKTVIFVSHDREEVYRQSAKISVIHQGKTSSMREKRDVFQNPETKETAILIGCENILSLEEMKEILKESQQNLSLEKGEKNIGIFGRNIKLERNQRGMEGETVCFSGEVIEMVECVASFQITLNPLGTHLNLRIEGEKSDFLSLSIGEIVEVVILRKDIIFLRNF